MNIFIIKTMVSNLCFFSTRKVKVMRRKVMRLQTEHGRDMGGTRQDMGGTWAGHGRGTSGTRWDMGGTWRDRRDMAGHAHRRDTGGTWQDTGRTPAEHRQDTDRTLAGHPGHEPGHPGHDPAHPWTLQGKCRFIAPSALCMPEKLLTQLHAQ